jgi:chaperonin GroEL (HSP60 family)
MSLTTIGQILTETAKTVKDTIGDGVKTSIILVGKLLDKAQNFWMRAFTLEQSLYGYKKASEKPIQIAADISEPFNVNDEKAIRNVALTAMASKIPKNALSFVAVLVTDAVKKVSEKQDIGRKLDVANVKIEKIENGP